MREGFKPGRATSPIPPLKRPHAQAPCRGVSNPDGPPLPFQHRSIASSPRFPPVSNPSAPPLPFQHRSIAASPRFPPVSNPDGPPLPFQLSLKPSSRGASLQFQTRTGHLSHANNATKTGPGRVATGFKPGRATSPIPTLLADPEAIKVSIVSNPDGPPLPFQR